MTAKKTYLMAGVLVALVATAPAAWAFGATAEEPCGFVAQGTDASQESTVTDDKPVNLVAQAPVAGGNHGVFGECSTFGQNNNQGNFENNTYVPPLGLPTGLPR